MLRKPTNLLFILSDEHQRGAAGCYGHPMVQTPNLDRLASRGARFTGAYTPCPICVPARASLITGRHVHEIGNWDNAFPYDGHIPGWAHAVRACGMPVVSIGKLHFRSADEDHGFTEEIDPLHVVDGIGDPLSCLREDPPVRSKLDGIDEAGPGDSSYLQYDARIAEHACRWLREHAQDERPWVLFVSFVCPHPPYIAPPRLFDLYPPDQVPMPPQWQPEERPDHPGLRRMREKFGLEPLDEPRIRKAISAYLGACTYLDERIGDVLGALRAAGLHDRTRVIYSSDHGEDLGARGLFGKFTMYEESAGVPLIVAGPDVPPGVVVDTPVSLVDLFPTITAAVGLPADTPDYAAPLWEILETPERFQERPVISQYHAVNSRRGISMLRQGRHKLVYYVEEPPQLFDLQSDPLELHNLADEAAQRPILERMEATLRAQLDPEAVDARARADQAALIARLGGEEAVRRRGTFDNSPVPGEQAEFRDHA